MPGEGVILDWLGPRPHCSCSTSSFGQQQRTLQNVASLYDTAEQPAARKCSRIVRIRAESRHLMCSWSDTYSMTMSQAGRPMHTHPQDTCLSLHLVLTSPVTRAGNCACESSSKMHTVHVSRFELELGSSACTEWSLHVLQSIHRTLHLHFLAWNSSILAALHSSPGEAH